MLRYTSVDCLHKTCTYTTCFAEQKIILEQKGPANLAKLVLHLKSLCKENIKLSFSLFSEEVFLWCHAHRPINGK